MLPRRAQDLECRRGEGDRNPHIVSYIGIADPTIGTDYTVACGIIVGWLLMVDTRCRR